MSEKTSVQSENSSREITVSDIRVEQAEKRVRRANTVLGYVAVGVALSAAFTLVAMILGFSYLSGWDDDSLPDDIIALMTATCGASVMWGVLSFAASSYLNNIGR